MTNKQIASKYRKLQVKILKRQGIHIRAMQNEKRAKKKVDEAQQELYKLRVKCKHIFDHENNPTMMGKGKCEICGHDDY